MADEYLILRHEKLKFRHLIPHLACRKRLTTGKFAEHRSAITELHEHRTDLVTALTLVLQKILSAISTPMKILGHIIEFILNFWSLNGGLFGIWWRIITFSLVFPFNRQAANYKSLIGHIDSRFDMHGDIHLNNYEPVEPIPGLKVSPINLSIMAAKLSYENAAFVRNVVNDQWKMHFVRFFSCYNKYLKNRGTQAYIFTDRPENAALIVLAFRGTEPFNAVDWITDVDLSWLKMGKLGRVHLGFMRALGLQDEKDISKGFPKEYTEDEEGRSLAYYAIRETLKALLVNHPNAKILITGHSLGGALAALFPAILAFHDEQSILNSIYGVLTYGQPRVGDAVFGMYMKAVLGSRYHRMVYRYDVVPRVPFDKPPVAQFKHFGSCVYFSNWYEGEVVEEEPNPNYINPIYALFMHLSALDDLLKAFFFGLARVKDFDEGFVSLTYRAAGLILPGIAFHSPRDYTNGGKMARIKHKLFGFGKENGL